VTEPMIPYFVDVEGCAEGGHGCHADGKHLDCRFCGEKEFSDIPCPDSATYPTTAVPMQSAQPSCEFVNEPIIPYFVDVEGCAKGGRGCHADGKHLECRFCGGGVWKDIKCPDSATYPDHGKGRCEFVTEPMIPYFVDVEGCAEGGHGCHADGKHLDCRFCGEKEFSDIPCPDSATYPGSVSVQQ